MEDFEVICSDVVDLFAISRHSLCNGELDTTTASGDMIFSVFASAAQLERRLIHGCTKAGLAAVRARGHQGDGQKVMVDDPCVKTARTMLANKKLSVEHGCGTLKICRTTLFRSLDLKEPA